MPDTPSPSATSTPLAIGHDTAARRRIETSLDESLIVEAAAGTGKTTELVARLVAVLEEGKTTVDRLVAVTFTRKAAGELKLRLRQELDKARERIDESGGDPQCRRALEDALARLEEAHIGTIHSFCAEILRERPVEARVDPAFGEMDEEESARIYRQAFERWIERKLDTPSEALDRALARLTGQTSFDGSSPLDRLRTAGWSLVDWRDFETPWRREPFDRREAIGEAVRQVEAVSTMARACENHHDRLRKFLEPVVELDAWIRRSALDKALPEDELEARLVALHRDLARTRNWTTGRSKIFHSGLSRDEALERRDALLDHLENFKRRADADLATLLHDELMEVVAVYEEKKAHLGRLDFLDLLIRTRDLLRDNIEVRRFLQERFTHLFVDEFQDTDPLQAEILLLLAADDPEVDAWREARPVPGKLFLVGDPKQSIYRFRRADVVLYEEIKDRLVAGGMGLVHLSRSFRALEPLQAAVNAAFADRMTGDREVGSPEYVPLDPHRQTEVERPEIVALPAPKPYSFSRITARSIEACLPDTVAAYIEWLVRHSGWQVEDPGEPGRLVPIAPRHITLLFRRYVSWGNDVTRGYLQALEARNLPHLLVGGRSFHEREEVETLRAALMAIEWPDDELAVYATLRGSLFALPDNLLVRYRFEAGRLRPFKIPGDLADDFRPIAGALELLARLHRRRNRVPIVATLNRLLEATRAHAGFALRPAGRQVLANVERVAEMARGFEVRGGLSFRGFVERLTEEAERPGSSRHGAALEEGAEGVRVMTAHAAKGLQFPVVILADITAKLSRPEPSLVVDTEGGLAAQKLLGCAPWELLEAMELESRRDVAEGVRLAYVAATRARDLLVVPTVGDEPWESGWTSPLNPAIYPPKSRYRTSSPAPGCPPFGETTVLMRGDRQPMDMEETSVRPGLHRPERGEHTVVWWDPKTLRLDVEADFGVRQEKILSPEDAAGVAEGADRYEAWKARQETARKAGAKPELDVRIVTETDALPGDFSPEIARLAVERPAGRPSGARFGTLVHTVLRDVPYDAADGTIRDLTHLHGRMLDASAAEVEAAVDAVRGALAHDVLRRAARAERCHREAPFVLKLDEHHVVEGTIDLLFRQEGGYVVVDFKTDADPNAQSERYERQLAWYLFAVERMMGARATGILLGV